MAISRETALVALVAAVLASGATFIVDRIVFPERVIVHDRIVVQPGDSAAAAELRREYELRQRDEAAAVKWATQAHAPGSPLNH